MIRQVIPKSGATTMKDKSPQLIELFLKNRQFFTRAEKCIRGLYYVRKSAMCSKDNLKCLKDCLQNL